MVIPTVLISSKIYVIKSKTPKVAAFRVFALNLITLRSNALFDYRAKQQLKVDGKMSTQGSDFVGKTLALAVAAFLVMAGIALILFATN